MAYVSLDNSGNVVAVYNTPQNDPKPSGYAVIPDNDIRMDSYKNALQEVTSIADVKSQLSEIDSKRIRILSEVALGLGNTFYVLPDGTQLTPLQNLQNLETAAIALRNQLK